MIPLCYQQLCDVHVDRHIVVCIGLFGNLIGELSTEPTATPTLQITGASPQRARVTGCFWQLPSSFVASTPPTYTLEVIAGFLPVMLSGEDSDGKSLVLPIHKGGT